MDISLSSHHIVAMILWHYEFDNCGWFLLLKAVKTHQRLHNRSEQPVSITQGGLSDSPLTPFYNIRIWVCTRKLLTGVCFLYRYLCQLWLCLQGNETSNTSTINCRESSADQGMETAFPRCNLESGFPKLQREHQFSGYKLQCTFFWKLTAGCIVGYSWLCPVSIWLNFKSCRIC